MALDLLAVMRRLGVSLDTESPPITAPNVISWLGRVYDVSPEQHNLGMKEGMEIWHTGSGFAPLDLAGIETWLFDAPRGKHLIIAERKVNFDSRNVPSRDGRELVIWDLDDYAAFIGHAVIDGRLSIIDEYVENIEKEESKLFTGPGPFVLKPQENYSKLESEGLEVGSAKPVLIPAKLHHVSGTISGPESESVSKWVLNCGGLHLIENVELLSRPPLISHEHLEVLPNPDFSDIMSERRAHADGMGELLHWWYFDSEGAKIETYEVLVPGHKGIDASDSYWILEGVSNTLHLNQ